MSPCRYPDLRPGEHGDLALPLLKPQQSCGSEADAKFRYETGLEIETKEDAALEAAITAYREALEAHHIN